MERPSTELPCFPAAFSLPEGIGFLISASLADRGRVRCRDSVNPDFSFFLSQLTLKKKKVTFKFQDPIPSRIYTPEYYSQNSQFHTAAAEEFTPQRAPSVSIHIPRF